MNLASLGDESLRRYGEYPALVFEGRELTNADQQRAASRLAHALRRLGIGPGDRVAVLLPNCPEVIQSYAAILKVGAVIVPTIFLLSPAEILRILEHAGVRLVITAPDLAWKIDGWPGRVVQVGGGGSGAGGLAYEELLAGEPDAFPAVDRADADPAVVLYTAGTTGQPKGVALSHGNLAANARATASLYELDREAWALAALPLSHSYGLTLMNAGNLLGTRAVLLRWFSPEGVLEAIQTYRVQAMAGVPTMWVYLLSVPDPERFDTRSMRIWSSGAAPLPVEIVEPFERRFGGRLLEGYGLTEAGPVVSAHRYSGPRKLGSVGSPIPGVEVRIVDDEDRPLPTGDAGEICVRSPGVMLGYYRMEAETAAVLRGGWLRTGDVGRLDEDGFLYIVERKKDLIIVGGLNVYPREVEEQLYAHPGVAEAAVVGIPDPAHGEAVVAFVVGKPGERPSADQVIAFCRERLARFKCPRDVRFVDALPKSPIGKTLRKELRALVTASTGKGGPS
jgi:long-chain acyl-CoA synthetase